MSDDQAQVANDPPTPAIADVEQRPMVGKYPAVPVTVVGPVLVQEQPARTGYCTLIHIGPTPTQVVASDPRRQSVTLISDTAWLMLNKASGAQCPIPANVPIVVHHASEIWAAAENAETELTAIIELYAQ